MGPDDIPLFGMLKSRLGYLTERQKLVAQNVANADTSGYRPTDLKPFSFQASLMNQASGAVYRGGPAAPTGGVRMIATSASHMAPSNAPSAWRATAGADSETTLDGNAVSLEDQMLKMTDARMNYDAAITFYQKSLTMLRMAARKPNG
ncbi:flagellar basal body rod protein FlgB [Caulobacter sp.]|uniref:flagellar basal body rod protein FlgB n=1 Tax=Caulobacter sp. TaxID=78 RepID=UPI002B4768B7|nr:flagellar basal body rod protein FlgB [Caulobacter sp.]HJV42733.1 flagellar basal body rod protein FlgB [Caulobacter sp.]